MHGDDNDVWTDALGALTAPDARTGVPETSGAAGEVLALDDLPETEIYQAYKARDKDPFCLSVYTNGPANVHPAYQYYQYVADDGSGLIFDIVYAFFVVRARGRNLLPVVHAVKSKKCVFIQQYQRRAHWREPGKKDTVIEKIEIVHQPSARVAMLERGGVPALEPEAGKK
jgi:hypothetical protein